MVTPKHILVTSSYEFICVFSVGLKFWPVPICEKAFLGGVKNYLMKITKQMLRTHRPIANGCRAVVPCVQACWPLSSEWTILSRRKLNFELIWHFWPWRNALTCWKLVSFCIVEGIWPCHVSFCCPGSMIQHRTHHCTGSVTWNVYYI